MRLARLLSICLALVACAGSARCAIVYVKTSGNDANSGLSWSAAKQTVQAAVNLAASGDEVWVAAGVYAQCITIDHDVALYGGFAGNEGSRDQRNWTTNASIIEFPADAPYYARLVYSTQVALVIDGFTICNGGSEGVFCNGSSGTIANNTITGNGQEGIRCVESSLTITGNTISLNGSTGVNCSGVSSSTITANKIVGNENSGVVFGCAATGVISNNLIRGNSSQYGAAIWCDGASPTITNNTITANTASADGGGLWCHNSSAVIASNIVTSNSSGICAVPDGTLSLRNNDVHGNTSYQYSGVSAGPGDCSVDPLFEGAARGDYHLSPTSPCIDAGYDDAVPQGALDLDGSPRISGDHVDIGAYEYIAVALPEIAISAPSATLTGGGPVRYTVTYTGADSIILAAIDVTLNRTGTANGTVSVSMAAGNTRTVTIWNITGSGTLGISIAADTASNTGGSALAAGPSDAFTVVSSPPSVAIGAPSAAFARGGPITYTVTYSGADAVTLLPANVKLNKTGTAKGTITVTGGGTATRTVTISKVTGNGTLGISIAAGTASNTVGKALAAGPSGTCTVDNTPPTVAIGAPSATLASHGPITYAITYSGANTVTLTDNNVTLNKTGTANGTVTVTGSGVATRTVTISGITGDGTLGISLPAGTASDNAGNLAGAVGPSKTFAVDNTGPLVTIGAPSKTATRVGPITYKITYTGAKTVALTADDIRLHATGIATGTLSVSGSGASSRTVTISKITGNGTLSISLPAGTAVDLAGNPAPIAGPSATFAVDNTAPVVAISAPSVTSTRSGPVSYTVTYTGADAVTLTKSKVVLAKTGKANGTVTVTGAGTTTRTVTISKITGNGTLGISISAGTASDIAGNLALATGPSGTFIATLAPQISISAPSVSDAPVSDSATVPPISYTITYSYATAVSLTEADVTLNKTDSADGIVSVTGTGLTTRTVTISDISGEGTLGISIAAGTASNADGSAAAAGPSATSIVTQPVSGAMVIRWDPRIFDHGQDVVELQVIRDQDADDITALPVRAISDIGQWNLGRTDLSTLYNTGAPTPVSCYQLPLGATTPVAVNWNVPAEPYGTTHTYQLRALIRQQTGVDENSRPTYSYAMTKFGNQVVGTAVQPVTADLVDAPAYGDSMLINYLDSGYSNLSWANYDRQAGANQFRVTVWPVNAGTIPTWTSSVINVSETTGLALPEADRLSLLNVLSNNGTDFRAYVGQEMNWRVDARHAGDTNAGWTQGDVMMFSIEAMPGHP